MVLHAPCRQREVVGFEIKSFKYVMLKPIDITLGTLIILSIKVLVKGN